MKIIENSHRLRLVTYMFDEIEGVFISRNKWDLFNKSYLYVGAMPN